MQNSLYGGDWVLQNPFRRSFARGDIVILRSPVDGQTLITKRIIAFGGDSVAICAGQLFISGVRFSEPYAVHFDTYQAEQTWWPIDRADRPGECESSGVSVPEGSVFVMGDNRDLSEDSRSFGSVALSSVVGKASVVLWSSRKDTGNGPIPRTNSQVSAVASERRRWLQPIAAQAPTPEIATLMK